MTAILDGNCHVPCGGTIEGLGLYLSVLDFEDRTLKTITFCVWRYELIFFLNFITDISPL